MKKIIPFTKEIQFKTMISEITDINLEHDLEILDNSVEGNFTVSGKYKMTDASVIEEDFLYKLPFTIEIDDKYDLTDSKVSIHDFYFEIINEEILKVNIEVELDNFVEKEDKKEDISLDIDKIRNTLEVNDVLDELVDEKDMPTLSHVDLKVDELNDVNFSEPIKINDVTIPEKVEVQTTKTEVQSPKTDNNSADDVEILDTDTGVSSIFSSISKEETFSTYHVYIVRENDTLDQILEKYKVSKEEVAIYNDLNDIKVGSKLIIPCNNE